MGARVHTFRIWLVIGIAAISAVMMIDLGRLLGDIQSPGYEAYDAGVFTEPTFTFLDTTNFENAIALWNEATKGDSGFPYVYRLVVLHLLVDALAFAPAYCFLIFLMLRRLPGGSPTEAVHRFAFFVSASVLVTDEIETFTTLFVIHDLVAQPKHLILIQGLTLTKWLALTVAIVPAAIIWGTTVVQRRKNYGRTDHPGRVLAPLIVLVGLFAALVALPAGGPLEQLPDVLRAQLLSWPDWGVFLRSAFALALFAACVTIAGHASIAESWSPQGNAVASFLANWKVVLAAAGVSAVLSIAVLIQDRAFSWVPSSYFFVACGLVIAARLARGAGLKADMRPNPADYLEEANTWINALAGAVVVVGGLGLIRAAFPPLVVGLEDYRYVWWIAGCIGVLVALGGGFATQQATGSLRRALKKKPVHRRVNWITVAWVTVAVIVGTVAGLLARFPLSAGFVGTPGVIAISFALLALLIGFVKRISRRHPPWEAAHSLRLGNHTPWLALLVLTWLVASALNSEGVYHDARIENELGPSNHRYTDLRDAFNDWLNAQRECQPAKDQPIPLVLVAASGGGIRAAYWTSATLDSLFSASRHDDCAARRLFAISGVSGGSVGATTWIAARAAKVGDHIAPIAELSKDHALAAAVAGMLLRDLWQPFIGVSRGWRDRAALLEDGWRESASVYGDSATTSLKWSALGDGLSWVPAIVLNASSVTDGCRVLVSNVGALPASAGKDCGVRNKGLVSGPVSGSIDALQGLCQRVPQETARCAVADAKADLPTPGMRAVTATLLSARFPFLTPSGALLRRVPAASTQEGSTKLPEKASITYVVDGGYYENSGLLTLLEIWGALEPMVRAYNQAAGAGSPIAPWIVVADNHYRSDAQSSTSRRPRELAVPFFAVANDSKILSQSALEQMAVSSLTRPVPSFCPPDNNAESTRHPTFCAPDSGGAQTLTKRRATENCLVVISPSRKPSVSAPLGWVLSQISRADLQAQLGARIEPRRGAPSTEELLRQLGKAPTNNDHSPASCVWARSR
jgi:hypothetical protein